MRHKLNRILSIPHKLLLLILLVPVVATARLLRPWFLIRWGVLPSSRIGHFGANTELYLCERQAGINLPRQPHIDVFFMESLVCNEQLARMWKRVLRICPFWWLAPQLARANRLIPGGAAHVIGENTKSDRDVHNLFDRFPSHLKFTSEEEKKGEAGLRAMGISVGEPFVCLIARDSTYLDALQLKDWSYHNFRDSGIQSYVLAAETLADCGYFVLRMGAKVSEKIKSKHPKVIDYATNGMRSDFMDIYLGASCVFCLSTSTGFDAVPSIFRRPLAHVNMAPVGYIQTFRNRLICITKHHYSVQMGRNLTMREIFQHGLAKALRTSDYDLKEVKLSENTPEEIRDLAIEMSHRIDGTWEEDAADAALQQQFQEIFRSGVEADAFALKALHGNKIYAQFGAAFLRNNPQWVH